MITRRDVAVIVVPAANVVEVAKACGRKGVKALVVISAGFSETGAAGQTRQAELVGVCRAAGMRLIPRLQNSIAILS
jgi:acyl-CoA synthetase (NDP forming)